MTKTSRAAASMLPAALLALFALLTAASPAAAGEARIRVLPERVYAHIVYIVRFETDADLRGRYLSWSATAGEMISDGEREAHWRAPPRPGEALLSVAALDDNGEPASPRAELRVVVHRPSTEGMVFIPAGTFTMGDRLTDVDAPEFIPTVQNIVDKPAHLVHLDGYWIDRNKVTNEEFVEFLNDFHRQGMLRVGDGAVAGIYEGVEVPFYFFRTDMLHVHGQQALHRGSIRWDGERFSAREGREKHPVMDVTWPGAVTYAFYHGKRLPREAEWERAARGGDDREFPWGDAVPTRWHANVNARFGDTDVPVGSFSPTGDSPYGIADLIGGLEWTHDWFGSRYFEDNYSEEPIRNPRGPEWGFDHPVRGISVYHDLKGDRFGLEALSFRYQWVFEFEHGHLFAHKDTGFRLAMSPLPGETPGGEDSADHGDGAEAR